MADVRLAKIAERTGFGVRYWQRRISHNEVPGSKFVNCGSRRIFLIDEAVFNPWWEKQKVQIECRPFDSVVKVKRGGTVSPIKESVTKVHWEQSPPQSLEADLKRLSNS